MATRIHPPSRGPLVAPKPFIGPYPLPTLESARALVRSFTAGSSEQCEAVAKWIAATGDCVLHASFMVFGGRCDCADCSPEIRRLA